jgi:hypothetical protein
VSKTLELAAPDQTDIRALNVLPEVIVTASLPPVEDGMQYQIAEIPPATPFVKALMPGVCHPPVHP